MRQSFWAYRTVEWSTKIQSFHSHINATHFVLPDLPKVLFESDRGGFFDVIPPQKRIQTIAVCNHTEKSLRAVYKNSVVNANTTTSGSTAAAMECQSGVAKILLVGGNDKNSERVCSLSTIEAARILRDFSETPTDAEIWGVANPNDEKSIMRVDEKIQSGITGFITQPLLSSAAMDILQAYPKENATFIAGIAMPTSNRGLQFWLKLLEQPELEDDQLFKSHMAFFQSPNFTSMAWIRQELANLESRADIDGVHFMPMNNLDDLSALLRM